jgi:uncharacterized protein YndB with AHSA1/START domain
MKILKKLLLGIAILIVLALITALFVKKEYSIERNVTINKPKQEVFDYIKLVNNQVYYNKWVMTDPNVKRTSTGTDGTVGFSSSWVSDNKEVGSGEQEIKKIVDGDSIVLQLHFIKPFEGMADAVMATDSVASNQTKVKWVFSGSSPYPMNLMNLCMDKMMGKDMDSSLTNLKTVLEK